MILANFSRRMLQPTLVSSPKQAILATGIGVTFSAAFGNNLKAVVGEIARHALHGLSARQYILLEGTGPVPGLTSIEVSRNAHVA